MLGTYNYLEEMKHDILNYIEDNGLDIHQPTEEIYENLYDELWIEDSVTGNASGSYTFNRELAKEYVLDNLDILADAAGEFGVTDMGNKVLYDSEWEYADVTIRCYLLSEAIQLALEDILEEV